MNYIQLQKFAAGEVPTPPPAQEVKPSQTPIQAPANGPYTMADRSPEDQANVMAVENARKYPNIPKSYINLAGIPNGKGVAHTDASEFPTNEPRARYFAHKGKSKTPYFDARYTTSWHHMGESDSLAGQAASLFDKNLPPQEYMTTENYTNEDVAKARAAQAQALATKVVPPTDPRYGNVVKYLINAGEINSDWFDKYKTLPGSPWFREDIPLENRTKNPYGPDPEGFNEHEIGDWHLLHDKLYRLRHSMGDTANPAQQTNKVASYVEVQKLSKQAAKTEQPSESQKLFDAANQKKIDFLGGLSNIGAGAGLGALGGGLVSLLPTSTPKKDRLRRAIMLMVQGGIIGGSMAGIGQYTTGYTLNDAKNGLVSSYKDWKADRDYRKAEQRAKELAEQGEIIA